MDKRNLRFAVIGGGNGGQTFAGHLSLLGFPVVLYDVVPNTVNAINQQGGICLDGAVKGFGRVSATLDMAEATDGADIIMVVTPAFAHGDVAQKLASCLEPHQVVVINPGSTFGALEVWSELRNNGLPNVVAETQTLLYACRATAPGRVKVGALKNGVRLASIPAEKAPGICQKLGMAFGKRFEPCDSVLVTSLSNINAVVHPASLFMMTSRIESSGGDFDFYCDGITPSIVKIIEALDNERRTLGEIAGIQLESVFDWYKRSYGYQYSSLLDIMRKNEGYRGLKAPRTLLTRYLTEDVPYGLVPMYLLGKLLSLDMKLFRAFIDLASAIVERDLEREGRTPEKVGLAGFDACDSSSTLADYLKSLR